MNRESLVYLQNQGLTNPLRIKRLVEKAIKRLSLDMKGMVVFTEAASRNYVVTPIIAALAGASKVYAITIDSQYGRAKEIRDFTLQLAEACGADTSIEIIYEKKREYIGAADIITNLGFVRPIDAGFLEYVRQDAVVPYMCEAWEVRDGDVDLSVCRKRGIPVMATDESNPLVNVFSFSGSLCIKMLHLLEIEVFESKLAIISNDKFGSTISATLQKMGACVQLFSNIQDEECKKFIQDSDALIIADYKADRTIIGRNGDITAAELARIAPAISIVQFCGGIEVEGLNRFGFRYVPQWEVPRNRMGLTLADLGPKPVINLHASGLKVGEVMWRAKLMGLDKHELEQYVLSHAPAQVIG